MKQVTSSRHYLPGSLVTGSSPLDIVVVGAGGIGSPLLSGLACMDSTLKALGHPGFHVDIIDGDTVSESNVGRQLFSRVDIGNYKSRVLCHRFNNAFGVGWRSYTSRLTVDNIREVFSGRSSFTIVITAVDNAPARVLVAKAKGAYTYWVDCGVRTDTGQVIIGTGPVGINQPEGANSIGTLPSSLDLYPDMVKQDKLVAQGPSCSMRQAIRRQNFMTGRFIADCALELLWKGFRLGYWDSHGAFLNLKTLSVRPLPVSEEVWRRMGWTATKPVKRKKALRGASKLKMAA